MDGDRGEAAATATELGLGFPILLDERQDASRAWDLSRLPATLVIDREGVVRYYHQGFDDATGALLAQQVNELLAE